MGANIQHKRPKRYISPNAFLFIISSQGAVEEEVLVALEARRQAEEKENLRLKSEEEARIYEEARMESDEEERAWLMAEEETIIAEENEAEV